MRGLAADPRQPELLRHGRDHGDCAVGGDREHAVHPVAPRHVGDACNVGEVDRLGDVDLGEPGRVGIAVDADHTVPELLRPLDRAPLVAPGADEEDGWHAARCYRPVGPPGYEPNVLTRKPGTRNGSRLKRAIRQPSVSDRLAKTGWPL